MRIRHRPDPNPGSSPAAGKRRFRRFLVFVSGLFLAFLVFLLLSPWIAAWLGPAALRRLGRLTQAEIEVDSMEVGFFPPRVILTGLHLHRAEAEGEDLRIACRRVGVDFPYAAYRGDFRTLRSVEAVGPEIVWRRGAGAEAGAPAPGPASTASLPIVIRRLRVEEGSLRVVSADGGWEAAVAGASLAADGAPAGGGLSGRLERSRVCFRRGETREEGSVQGAFRVEGPRVLIPEFRLETEDSIQVSGSLDLDRKEPTFGFHLLADARLPPGKGSRLLPGDLSGAVKVDARGEVAPDGLRLRGSVAAPEVAWRGLRVRKATGRGFFRPGRLELEVGEAEAFGGKVSGNAALDWGDPNAAAPLLDAQVSIEDASAEDALRFLGHPEIPVSGRFGHQGKYRMRGFSLSGVEGGGSLSLAGTLRGGPAEPVKGSGRFEISGSRLRVEEAVLEASSFSVHFAGEAPLEAAGKGRGTIRAHMTGLDPLLRFSGSIPAPARGIVEEVAAASPGADLEGETSVEWGPSGWKGEGSVVAQSLGLRGTRLGNLRTRFRFDPAGVAIDEGSLADGEVELSLTGRWNRDESFSVRGRAANVELRWLRDWAGISLPVDGKAEAEVDLAGRGDRLSGRIDWKVAQPVLSSLPWESAAGRLTFSPGVVKVEETRLARQDGEVVVSGEVGLGDRPIDLQARAHHLDLAWLTAAGLVSFDAAGTVEAQARLTGTLSSPLLETDLSLSGVKALDIDAGAFTAHFHSDREAGFLELRPEGEGVALRSRFQWKDDYPFQCDLDLNELRIASAALGKRLASLNATAVLTGSVHAEGSLLNLRGATVQGTLLRTSVELEGEKLQAQSPAYFHWRSPRLEVTPLRLAGGGSDVTLAGEYEMEKGAYRFTASGSAPLAVAAAFWPGLTASGTGDFSLSFHGTEERSEWEGWAALKDGRLQNGGLPLPISSLAGRVTLDPSGRFSLDGVSFEAGGGSVTLSGGGRMEGLRPEGLEIGISGTDVAIQAPEGFRGRYDMKLRLSGGLSAMILDGEIQLVRGVYSKDFRIESQLLSMGKGEGEDTLLEEGARAEAEASVSSAVHLDLSLTADGGLWIINDFATMEGRANLRIGGTLGAPEILGRISAIEGGIVRFRRAQYRVSRGDIDLVDLDRFNPHFDIAAQTRISEYDVQLTLKGSLEKFEYELTSTPPLSQPDIVALLVSGHTLQTLASPTAGGHAAEQAAAGYLTGALTQNLGGRIPGFTRLDQFSIDPVMLSREGNPASRVTVGKQISENLFAAYSTLLGTSSEEIYQVEYKISRDFQFTSIRDADGSIGGDFRYIFRRSTGPGPAVPPPVRPRIESVVVEGETGMGEGKRQRLYRLKAGDEMDRAREAEGVDRLLAYYRRKGFLEAKVDSRETAVPGNPDRVKLVLRVDTGPRIDLKVQGTRHDRHYEKQLREKWVNSVFPEDTPREMKEALDKTLQSEGYYQATVSLEVPEDSAERRKVVLAVDPGNRVAVERVELAGNQNLETTELVKVLRTRAGKHSYLNPDEAANDSLRLKGKYLVSGFPEAQVSLPEIDLSPDGKAIVRFRLTEGEPMRLQAIRVEGNQALETAALLEDFPLRPRDPFTRTKARAGADQMKLAYDRAGYPDAKITWELASPAGGDLVYRVEEGQRHQVGRIEIEGNRLTRPEVIERELTFKEGDPIGREARLKSQLALYRLGIFQMVEIQETGETGPGQSVVRVRVAESPNLIQSFGIGYATDEGVRGLYELTNTNLLGRSRTVGFHVRGSGIDERVGAFLRDPYLFNRRLDSLVDTFWERQEETSFTEETVQATLQVSRKFGPYLRSFNRYTLKSVSLSDLKVTEEEAGVEDIRLGSVSSALVHDTRDNFYDPRSGVFESFDVGLYAKFLASEARFAKFFGTSSMFHKIGDDAVWGQCVRFGFEDPYGGDDSVPLSERFLAGGDTTIRGFDRNEAGPKDPVTGEPIGGQILFIVNEEYRFPIWRFLRGVVFVDVGNVFADFSQFDLSDLRKTSGLGFRIDTPIGPFRLEYGWKLDREEGESPGRLHISIGQAF